MSAHENLRTALAEQLATGTRAPCCWPDTSPLWTSESKTDREQAAEHCDGCALLALCHEAAESTGERWHVWAGRDRTPTTRKARP